MRGGFDILGAANENLPSCVALALDLGGRRTRNAALPGPCCIERQIPGDTLATVLLGQVPDAGRDARQLKQSFRILKRQI